MSPRQLRSILKKLSLTQVEAARRLAVNPRSMRRWIDGSRPIPGPVRASVRCWETLHDVKTLTED